VSDGRPSRWRLGVILVVGVVIDVGPVAQLQDKRARLEAHNQALASALSAANSAPRIEAAARRLGLIQASAGNMSYLDITAGGR